MLWINVCSIICFIIFSAAFFYKLGQASMKAYYAKDEEGYIDHDPKDCKECALYHNVDEWAKCEHPHEWGSLKSFCDYCAADNKKFFRRKDK